MADFVILRTADTVYLDRQNQAVNGKLVTVELPEFDEVHDVKVPSLDEKVVATAVAKLLAQRKALAELGA